MGSSPDTIKFGAYELRPRSRELYKLGMRLKLRPQPFQVLASLLEHAGDVVSRDQLRAELWPSDTFVDFEHSLNTAVKELRGVLDDSASNPRYIETLPKIGYRFVFPVERAAAGQPVPAALPAAPSPPPLLQPDLTGKPQVPLPEFSGAQPVALTRRRTWLSLAVAAALLLGLTLVITRMGFFRPSASGAASASLKPRPSIAVLGFKNLSQKPEDDWMSTAMSEMLAAELASGQQIRVVPAENVSRMKHDLSLGPADTFAEDTLAKIHNHLGSDMVASGSFLALPSGATKKLRIVLQVQDTRTGETVGAVTQDGTESDLPQLISAGGDSVRHTLGIARLSPSAAREVRAAIPANSEAERLYAEGLAKLQAYDALGARALLEKAIAADPGHALSHSALAECLHNLGYDLQAQSEAKNAFDLSTDLSREDRLAIEGRYRSLIHDRSGAVEIYRTLYTFFPDNLDYGLHFANAQRAAGQPADALQTIAALHKLPSPQGDDPRIDDLESGAAERLGDLKRSQQAAAAAITRAEAIGSNLLAAEALHRESFAWSNLGNLDQAIGDEVRGRSLFAAVGNTYDAAVSTHGIALFQKNKGDLLEARKNFESALAEFRRLGAQWDIASCSHNLGLNFLEQGDLEQARIHLEEALRIHRELNDTRGVAFNLDDLGNVELSVGNLELSQKMKEEALHDFQTAGDQRGASTTMLNLAEVLYQRGDLAGATQQYQQAMGIEKSIAFKSGLAYSLVGLAEVQSAQDRLSDAFASAQESLALREETKEEVRIAKSKLQLAMITLEQGQAAVAESSARAAIAVFEQHKASGFAAQAYAVLTRTLLSQRKLDEARAASNRANTLAHHSSDRMMHMQADLAAAELEIASGKAADAQPRLKLIRQQAHRDGYVLYELQARLLLVKAQLASGKTDLARSNSDQLQSDARSKGFLLIARQAATLRR